MKRTKAEQLRAKLQAMEKKSAKEVAEESVTIKQELAKIEDYYTALRQKCLIEIEAMAKEMLANPSKFPPLDPVIRKNFCAEIDIIIQKEGVTTLGTVHENND